MQPNSSSNDLLLLLIVGVLLMTMLALAFVLFFNFSQRRLLQAQMKSQEQALRHQEEMLESAIVTQESERRRIAKELHDDLGAKLNVIKLYLHQLKKQANSSDPFLTIYQDTQAVLKTTIDTTRRISHDLLPPTLEDFGLNVALEELCDQFNRSDTVKIDYTLEEALPELSINDSLNLFRIVQELINNSIRHGEASQIELRLEQSDEGGKLSYRDNGKGFDSQATVQRKGLGMNNIDSRVQLLKGKMDYFSAPMKGFTATIEYPIPDYHLNSIPA